MIAGEGGGGYPPFPLVARPVVLSAITKVLIANAVSRTNSESPLCADKRQVFPDPYSAVVEEDMVVRAQAEDVVGRVRPAMRRPERPDVCGLRVGTGDTL
jgi:hypothetical protein